MENAVAEAPQVGEMFEHSNMFVSGQSASAGTPALGQPAPPDVLKSKLLIGEFVVTSQNHSNSAARKSLLAENIIKLVSSERANLSWHLLVRSASNAHHHHHRHQFD